MTDTVLADAHAAYGSGSYIEAFDSQTFRLSGGQAVELWHARQAPFEIVNPAVDCLIVGFGGMLGDDRLEVDYGDGRKALRCPPAGFHVNATQVDAYTALRGPSELLTPVIRFDDIDDLLGFERGTVARGIEPLHDIVGSDPTMDFLVRRMWAAGAAHGPMAGLFLEQGMMTLTLGLLVHARGPDWCPRDPGGTRLIDWQAAADRSKRPPSQRLTRVLDYIEAHLDAELRLDTLAKVGGASASTLTRLFRAELATTPHRYVLSRRIAHAQALLRDTRLSMTEIGYDCGFSSPAHFSNIFKQCVGVAPRDWVNRA